MNDRFLSMGLLLGLFALPSIAHAHTGNVCWVHNPDGSTTIYASTNHVVTPPTLNGFITIGTGASARNFNFTSAIPNASLPATSGCGTPGCTNSEVSWQTVTIPAGTLARTTHSFTEGPTSDAVVACSVLSGCSCTQMGLFGDPSCIDTTGDGYCNTTTAPCMGVPEGGACMVGSISGICRMSSCCTGCWTGTTCVSGRTAATCGNGGAACRSCSDGMPCTTDTCSSTGVCSNPPAPTGSSCDDGLFCTATDTCNAAGTCVGIGDPCDDMQACTADVCNDTTDSCTNMPSGEGSACMLPTGPGMCRGGTCCAGCWDGMACVAGTSVRACGGSGGLCSDCADGDFCTAESCVAGMCQTTMNPAGTLCDDGMFCTGPDTCDAMGTCTGGAMACDDGLACTTDTCDEATDMCTATVTMGCVIGGACLAMGDPSPGDPCQICNPSADPMAYTAAPPGTVCGAGSCDSGTLTAQVCDAAGGCGPETMPCGTGRCADATSCVVDCMPGTCDAGEYCNTLVGTCQPALPDGTACIESISCASGFCVDGICCGTACDGTCEACGTGGACAPHAAGTDPDGECAPSSCDGAGACDGPTAGDAGGTGGDAGTPMLRRMGDAGCACHTTGFSMNGPPWAIVLLVAFAVLRRRRRARRP